MQPSFLVVGVEFTPQTTTLAGSVAVVILIGLSGFFSSAEIAMFSLPDHKIEAMVAENQPGAPLVQSLKDDPHRLLVTILVGNNIVNIATASITTTVLAIHFPPAEAVVIATFGITALVLLFGESAPKSYAVEHTDSWARRVARPLQLSSYVMYPLVVLFDFLTRQVNRLTGTGGDLESPYLTRTELQQLIETGEREGVIEAQESEFLRGVFQIQHRIVKEVMRSRLDMTAIEAAAPVGEAIELCLSEDRNRLPVFRETLDDIVGIVELADLVAVERTAAADGPPPVVEDVVEPALLVPESKDVDELLVEMRDEHRQMAVVVDEFGTTQGLVTVEDMLEEIVGEMLETTEQPAIEELGDDRVLVRGDVNIHEVNETLGIAIPEGEEFETIAGFVFDQLGEIPEEGETLTFDDLSLSVTEMDGRRIRLLELTLPPSAESGDVSADAPDTSPDGVDGGDSSAEESDTHPGDESDDVQE